MPLPAHSGHLSLQGSSRPGETGQAAPKRAMIVRMSAEAIDALSGFPNHPQMEFDFGDNLGIHIGSNFFPLKPHEEASAHELYLRATTANKPNAPLKLYANIAGKLIVERDLDAVTDKVREANAEAAKAKNKRIVMLDAPPAVLAVTHTKPAAKAKTATAAPKKRKPAGTAGASTKRAPQTIQAKNEGSAVARVPSPMPPAQPSTARPVNHAAASFRTRVVHCIAVAPRTPDDLVRMVARQEPSDLTRKPFVDLLEHIAEPLQGTKGPQYSLRPETWTEVRPYEWGALSESERNDMARRGRQVFSNQLKMPDKDPRWDHMYPRTSAAAASSSSTPAASAGPSKVGTPKLNGSTVKVKAEPKRAAAAEQKVSRVKIEAKDEIVRVASSSSRTHDKHDELPRPAKLKIKREQRDLDDDVLPSPALSANSKRRLPGSGFQSTSRDSPAASSGTGTPTPPSQPGASPVKRTGPVDARGRRDEPAPSGKASAAPPLLPPTKDAKREREREPVVVKKKIREEVRERERERESAREDGGPAPTGTGTLKRKKQLYRDDEDDLRPSPVPAAAATTVTVKRRKVEEDGAYKPGGSGKPRDRERDRDREPERSRDRDRDRDFQDTPPKRVARDRESDRDVSPPRKAGRERKRDRDRDRDRERARDRDRSLSPPPPPRKPPRDVSPARRPSERERDRGRERERERERERRRRRSPVYTSSSDDDGDTSPPARQANGRGHTHGGPSTSSATSSTSSYDGAVPRRYATSAADLPRDRAQLMSRYNERYQEHRAVFKKLAAQKSHVESALMTGNDEPLPDGSVFMRQDELQYYMGLYNDTRRELELIRDVYADVDDR